MKPIYSSGTRPYSKTHESSSVQFGIEPSTLLLILLVHLLKGGYETINEQSRIRNEQRVNAKIGELAITCPPHLSFREWMLQTNPSELSFKLTWMQKKFSSLTGKSVGEVAYKAIYLLNEYAMTAPEDLYKPEFETFKKILIADLQFSEPKAVDYFKRLIRKNTTPATLKETMGWKIFREAIISVEEPPSSQTSKQREQKLSALFSLLDVMGLSPEQQTKVLISVIEEKTEPAKLIPIFKKRISELSKYQDLKARQSTESWLTQQGFSTGKNLTTPSEQFEAYLSTQYASQKELLNSTEFQRLKNYLKWNISANKDHVMALFFDTESYRESFNAIIKAYADCFNRPIKFWNPYNADGSLKTFTNLKEFLIEQQTSPSTFAIRIPQEFPNLNSVFGNLSSLYEEGTLKRKNDVFFTNNHAIIICLASTQQEVEKHLRTSGDGDVEGFYSFASRVHQGYSA